MQTGPKGNFAYATCTYCHQRFEVYASDLQQSYDAQVEELPAPGYQSDGSLLWSPAHDYMVNYSRYYADNPSFCNHYSGTTESHIAGGVIVESGNNFVITASSGQGNFKTYQIAFYYSGVAPVAGVYERLVTSSGSATLLFSSGSKSNYSLDWGTAISSHQVGDEIVSSIFWMTGDKGNLRPRELVSLNGSYHAPIYKVTSVDFLLGSTIYNINSRPTSITGDYGIIGDNGQIIKVEGDKIVNETNNTIYNPATGETHTLSDWSYNYEDRSYTVTTETGDTITITYGDENVTIVEGDTTYNIYYLVDGSGSENPGPSVCDHIWTETGRTDPTCSTPGKVTSTCSKCNQTKTNPIPATGHTWVVDRTVQTTYDEEGNLLQQGYTIYSCSVCGEQYKDMEGTGPPGPPGSSGGDGEKSIWEKIGEFFGSIGGGFLEIIGAVAGKFLDALTKLAEMLLDKIKIVVETVLTIFDELPALFGGFLDFLAAIFPFLPPEITSILTFGVIAITFIGILKAVRR